MKPIHPRQYFADELLRIMGKYQHEGDHKELPNHAEIKELYEYLIDWFIKNPDYPKPRYEKNFLDGIKGGAYKVPDKHAAEYFSAPKLKPEHQIEFHNYYKNYRTKYIEYIKSVADMNQSTYDGFVKSWKAFSDAGYPFDFTHPDNISVDIKNQRIKVMDVQLDPKRAADYKPTSTLENAVRVILGGDHTVLKSFKPWQLILGSEHKVELSQHIQTILNKFNEATVKAGVQHLETDLLRKL